MNIRPGTISDLSEVQRLNQALFQYEQEQGYYPAELNLNWTYEDVGRAYFERGLSNDPENVVLIAEDQGKVIGYLAASFSTVTYRRRNPVAELDNMFVDQSHRRKGVGTKLVDAFKDWASANQVAYIRVEASVVNSKALDFYRRAGFRDTEMILEQQV